MRLVESIAARGIDFFRVACDRDLEGIVGKWAQGTYTTDGRTTSWVKVKNATYSSQADGRHELFAERRRVGDGARHPAPELRLGEELDHRPTTKLTRRRDLSDA